MNPPHPSPLWRQQRIQGTGVGPGCTTVRFLYLADPLPDSALFDGRAGNFLLQRSRADLLLQEATWSCHGGKDSCSLDFISLSGPYKSKRGVRLIRRGARLISSGVRLGGMPY